MLVIFDCDGVLIDSELIYCAVDAERMTGLGHPTSAADIARRFTGVPHRQAWEVLSAEIGFEQPAGWIDDILAECGRRFASDLKPIVGAGETLRQLRQAGVEVCVASSSGLPHLRANLAQVGLLGEVEPHVYSVTQVRRPKPAPDVFLFSASQLGCDPADCLVVEDSVAGVTAARRAGMRVVGFLGGGHVYDELGPRLLDAGAESLFHGMTELRGALLAVA